MEQTRTAIFLSQKPESERNKFSHFKIFRWLREVLFSLDLFSLQIRLSEKDRENLHFFFTDRQNWNTLTRFLCQVSFFFFAYCVRKRVPRNSTKYFFLLFIKDFVVRIWDKIVHFSETRRVNFGTKYLELCSDFVQHILFHEENIKKYWKFKFFSLTIFCITLYCILLNAWKIGDTT